MAKMMMNQGALKPDKVKKRKVTKHQKGHTPVGANDSFGLRQGSPNKFVG